MASIPPLQIRSLSRYLRTSYALPIAPRPSVKPPVFRLPSPSAATPTLITTPSPRPRPRNSFPSPSKMSTSSTQLHPPPPSTAHPPHAPLKLTHAGTLNLPGITTATTTLISTLLSHNHFAHHIFFNREGFHNHTIHYLLALYDLGASPPLLTKTYTHESAYQQPLPPVHPPILDDLKTHKWSHWLPHLGKSHLYSTFLTFFKNAVSTRHGNYKSVVKQYLFCTDHETVRKYSFGPEEKDYIDEECIDDTPDIKKIRQALFTRLFAGFFHPLIHLGYGIEFGISEIVCEALAQAASHEGSIEDLLLPAEQASLENKKKELLGPKHEKELLKSEVTLGQLARELRDNPKIFEAPKWEDGNKLQVLPERCGKEIVDVLSKFYVPANLADIQHRTAESISNAALLCASALRKDKQIRFDFFLMHSVTSSIFLSVMVNQNWISNMVKARLVEWKARVDLALYASRKCPELNVEEVKNYVPKEVCEENQWLNTISRALRLEDKTGGHGIKTVRALAFGERMCRVYEEQDKEGREFEMRGEMWAKFGAMVIDSLEYAGEASEMDWVRSAGFEEAWEEIGPRVAKPLEGPNVEGIEKGIGSMGLSSFEVAPDTGVGGNV